MTASVSVVVPVLNGAHLVPDAHARLRAVLGETGRPFELVFVDDGSSDATWPAIRRAAAADPTVRGVRLAANVGQAAAIAAGVRASSGTVVATTDVDLETEPEDLLQAVAAVESGHSVASGRRRSRRHWHRELPSQAFNLYGRASGIALRDLGCGTNAMARWAADAYAAVPDLRRELPTAVLVALGADIVEVDLRSRRPEMSQLGYRDLAALWLAFEARRGIRLRGPLQVAVGAVAAVVALRTRRGPGRAGVAAFGIATLAGPAVAAWCGRRWLVPAAPEVLERVGTEPGIRASR